jgi:predicted nucleotidyltransferase component of viral defense system
MLTAEVEARKILGVCTYDVQRDYLVGLYADNALMWDRFVLKGGNAFRKGYFVNTRFSTAFDFAARL